MKNSRQTAFEILKRIQKDNSYSNLVLDSTLNSSDLNQIDKAFASALVYGVIERLYTLDFEISQYLKQPLKKLNPQALVILRIGAYQLLFMKKIPASAAINESVKLTKSNGVSFASGLVNAVLRKISANGLTNTNDLRIKYSAPEWLTDMWTRDYGKENTIKLLEATFGSVETTLKTNTLKISNEELIKCLREEGFEAKESVILENSLVVNVGGALHKTKAYERGLFHVQDLASQLCCKALNADKDDVILDICAAPGGKSFTIAEMMNNSGKVYSMDLYQHRLDLIKRGAERLGITSIQTIVNDGSVYNHELPLADKILCDVPCAGLGVIRKKPEIRYKDSAEVDNLPDLQYSILCISSQYLKSEGLLIYSTCSLNKAENEEIIEKFLAEHSNFESVRVLSDLPRHAEDTDYITLMPHLHNCDGFFVAGIRKVKDV